MLHISIPFKSCLLIFVILFCFIIGHAQIITTYAGNGTIGNSGDGGLSVNSILNSPFGINQDAAGNLYVADISDSCIWKIDPTTNIITSIPVPGFSGPANVAFDKKGNMYIADGFAHCIWKMDVVTNKKTIIAGIQYKENTYYNVNGRDENAPATGAAFDHPTGIVLDDSDNIYIADNIDGRIRKIDAKTGLIHTVIEISFPRDLAWGQDGNLYITSQGEHTVLKFDLTTGIITRVAGVHNPAGYVYAIGYTGDGGPAREAKLGIPDGICFDKEGNLYIADELYHVIRKVDTNGIITTVAGTGAAGYTGDCGPALKATLKNPEDVLVDANGIMYIADLGNHVVRKITNNKPNLITGSSDICVNSTIQLTNEAVGGSWQSSQPAIATIDAAGKVTGIAAGSAKITYTVVLEGCSITVDDHTVTVHNISEANAKKESLMVCKGSSVSLGNAINGGVWSNTNDNVALIDAASTVHGLSKGQATLRYTVSQTCSVNNIIDVTINDLPAVFLGRDTSFCSNTPLQLNAGANWKLYQWNTGETSQFKSVTTAGMYAVTIKDENGCTAADTIRIVNVFTPPVLNWNAGTALCSGRAVILTVPANLQSVVWQDGSASNTYTITHPGIYWGVVTDKHGCSTRDTVVIDTLINKASGTITPDTTICSYDAVLLATSVPFASYQWSTGSTQPAITVNKGGRFQLQVQDRYGCSWNFSTTVAIKDCYSAIFFPTAFTPDGNGLNDYFRPKVDGSIRYFKMIVYSRWGQPLFETTDWHSGWNGYSNGLLQPQGTYVWTAVYELTGGKRKAEHGTFVLLR